MRPTLSTVRLPALALVAVLSVAGCSDDPGDNAPAAVETVPSAVASAVTSDVGQFLVKPAEGTPQADVDATLAKLKAMPSIETAAVNDEGFLDVVLRPNATPEQRSEIVRQMAALGEVIEGI